MNEVFVLDEVGRSMNEQEEVRREREGSEGDSTAASWNGVEARVGVDVEPTKLIRSSINS